MELSNCTEDEFEIYKKDFLTLSTWNMASLDDIRKIEIDGETVALIECAIDVLGENSTLINNFEVFSKGNGIGSRIIRVLTKDLGDGEELYAYPYSDKSEAFWKKHKFRGITDVEGAKILRYSE